MRVPEAHLYQVCRAPGNTRALQYSREGHLTRVNWFVLKAAAVLNEHKTTIAARVENRPSLQSIKDRSPVS